MDFNKLAKKITGIATGEIQPKKTTKMQELGKLGGLKGGKARAEKLTAAERTKIAKNAAAARWKKKK